MGFGAALERQQVKNKKSPARYSRAAFTSSIDPPSLSAPETPPVGEMIYESALNGHKVAFHLDPGASPAFMSL